MPETALVLHPKNNRQHNRDDHVALFWNGFLNVWARLLSFFKSFNNTHPAMEESCCHLG
jgi:hypothetical protein